MKRYLMIIVAVLFMGCSLDGIKDLRFSLEFSNIELTYEGFDDINSTSDINRFIRREIEYKDDPNGYTQSPAETLELGTGDCEDFAILFMNIAYVALDIKYDLALVSIGERAVIDGGSVNHIVVYRDKLVYEPKYNGGMDTSIGYIYAFDTVFSVGE